MEGSIENKFKGIIIDSHEGNSRIKIRGGLHFPLIIGPKAIVECGSCGNKYKKGLEYSSTYFVMQNDDLKCKCGNIDYLSYRLSKIKLNSWD
jgi:hypothetical protein